MTGAAVGKADPDADPDPDPDPGCDDGTGMGVFALALAGDTATSRAGTLDTDDGIVVGALVPVGNVSATAATGTAAGRLSPGPDDDTSSGGCAGGAGGDTLSGCWTGT